MKVSTLWTAPEINPLNHKALSIPVFNVRDPYGRVFFFCWFGFMIAFWAWYAFPPLITHVIKADLHLTPVEVANSNIVSLVATLFVRYLAGPLSDQIGPRRVFAGLLLVGSIPLGLSALVHDAPGLYTARFFTGLLGGTFVPCLVWCTAFFDRPVVGAANALAAGWGNAGGGLTYFVTPAVFDALRYQAGYGDRTAWRLTFLVPLAAVLITGICMLLFCPDTPTGPWSERFASQPNSTSSPLHAIDDTYPLGSLNPRKSRGRGDNDDDNATITPTDAAAAAAAKQDAAKASDSETEKPTKDDDEHDQISISRGEVIEITTTTTADDDDSDTEDDNEENKPIQPPTISSTTAILLSPQTLFHTLTYLCSFGGELAVNSVLSAYYLQRFPSLGAARAAQISAAFGFMNLVTRPLGGFVSDWVYRVANTNTNVNSRAGLWAKKIWIVVCGVLAGALLVGMGVADDNADSELSTTLALVSVMAVFLEAANGANFGLVPHVHPRANGVVSGVAGAAGNLGGVVFGVVFRFAGGGANNNNYGYAFRVIGAIHILLNLLLCWVPPVPTQRRRRRVGGR